MTIEELLKNFSNEQGFIFGIDIVMQSLRPHALYEIIVADDEYIITRWDDVNKLPAPSSQEIKNEYIRHKTIREVFDYIQSNQETQEKK